MVKRNPQEDIVKYPRLKRLQGLGLTNVKWHLPGPFVETDKGTGSSRKKKNPHQEPVREKTHPHIVSKEAKLSKWFTLIALRRWKKMVFNSFYVDHR